MANEEKTAIVYAGGGMRSAHGAGFLCALAEHLPSIRPDIMIASSGATGNSFYFISKQSEYIRTVWNDVLPTSPFISWMRFWRIMDITYLVDDIFKKQFPLDTKALEQSPMQYFVPLLDIKTGAVRYARKDEGPEPFALLRASKSMPFFYGKATEVLGREYIDGGVAVTIRDMVSHARKYGATRILIIDNRTQLDARKRTVVFLYAYTIASACARSAMVQWIRHFNEPLDTDGVSSLLICPQTKMFTATRNQKKIRALFQMGYEDALARGVELRNLFNV